MDVGPRLLPAIPMHDMGGRRASCHDYVITMEVRSTGLSNLRTCERRRSSLAWSATPCSTVSRPCPERPLCSDSRAGCTPRHAKDGRRIDQRQRSSTQSMPVGQPRVALRHAQKCEAPVGGMTLSAQVQHAALSGALGFNCCRHSCLVCGAARFKQSFGCTISIAERC